LFNEKQDSGFGQIKTSGLPNPERSGRSFSYGNRSVNSVQPLAGYGLPTFSAACPLRVESRILDPVFSILNPASYLTRHA
jgi:hypothetical protein